MQRTNASLILVFPMVLATTACPGDDDNPEADTGGADDTAAVDTSDDGPASASTSGADASTGVVDDTGALDDAGDSSGGPDLEVLYACEEPQLVVAQPLSGPGFDPETGELVEPIAEYVVSTTQILPKADAASGATFEELVNQSITEAMATPGFVGLSLAFEPTCGFARTLSVWESQEAMIAFAVSDAHHEAVQRTFEVGITGRVTHFTVAAEDMPVTWDTAIAEIEAIDPIGGY